MNHYIVFYANILLFLLQRYTLFTLTEYLLNINNISMAVLWRIDSLSQQEIEKYRQRSTRAINGLRMCLKYADAISKYEKIGDKYKTLANYMGLAQEGGNSYYNYFIPINEDLVFMLRNASHDNKNEDSYNKHEQLGRPNKRFVIYFKNGNTFKDNKMIFLDAEHHLVPYNVNALDNEASVTAYINSLINLFENGKTTFPSLPIIAENKQYKSDKKMKYTIKESQLHKIIAESVKKVLSELDARTYASYADKRAAQGNYDKAAKGVDAARDAWNNKFSHDDNFAHGYSKENMIDTSDSPYTVHSQSMSRDALGNAISNNVNQVNPQNDKRTADRYRVAQQMAQGNGKYVKGQGWQ